MAVKIRLMRVGKKKQPTYRVVVADARSPRDGRFIEILGQYAPRQEPSVVTIDSERALHWLNARRPADREAAKLLEIAGVWDAYKQANGKVAAAKPKAKRQGEDGQGSSPRRRGRTGAPPRPRRPRSRGRGSAAPRNRGRGSDAEA